MIDPYYYFFISDIDYNLIFIKFLPTTINKWIKN